MLPSIVEVGRTLLVELGGAPRLIEEGRIVLVELGGASCPTRGAGGSGPDPPQPPPPFGHKKGHDI